jgi:hypothetical protein
MPRPLVIVRNVVPARRVVAWIRGKLDRYLRDNLLHSLNARSVSCHEWPVGGSGVDEC